MVLIILGTILIISFFTIVIDNRIVATTGVISFLISLILCIVFLILDPVLRIKDINITEDVAYEIYSINDNIELNGRFTLGTGRIEGIDYYYFYKNTKNGYKVSKIEATSVYIQETDKRKPQLTYKYHKYIYPDWYKKYFILNPNPHDQEIITIYVPKNTIKQRYTLDLK
jgi:hypothetical protein